MHAKMHASFNFKPIENPSKIPLNLNMKKIKFKKKYKWYSYIFPFQSIRQLIDTAIISGAITITFALLVDISYFEISMMFLAAWFFSWAVCYMTLPGTVIMEFENLIDDINRIEKLLKMQKYTNKKTGDLNLFIPEIPEFMKWKENIIKMHVNEKEIILIGPVFVMEMVAHKLMFDNK